MTDRLTDAHRAVGQWSAVRPEIENDPIGGRHEVGHCFRLIRRQIQHLHLRPGGIS
ncbi:MAG TPA: hypothetical protein VEO73_05165 [Gemmatimonadales bacterium]|nr:hypothetical protein [Gemmatimonadales bacterium]